MTDAPKLKPCPFCGSGDAVKGKWEDDGGSLYVGVQCCVCGAEFALPVQWDQHSVPNRLQEALYKWNTRHTPPEVLALVDALRQCCDELDEYSRQEYPLDHPVHERYRQRDYDANPARTALTNWEAMTK